MSQIQSQQESPQKSALSYLPVSFFGACMGLSAMSAAWHSLSNLGVLCSMESQRQWATCFEPPSFAPFVDMISLIFAILAVVAFVALSVAYIAKLIINFESCKQEFLSPITRPFFATICIALLAFTFCARKAWNPWNHKLYSMANWCNINAYF